MKIFASLFFICGLIQFGYSQPSQIDGEVFIVTAAHESVKLGLVAIAACLPDEFMSAIAPTKSQIESERGKLDAIRPKADEVAAKASELEAAVSSSSYVNFEGFSTVLQESMKLKSDTRMLADRVALRSEYLDSAAPYFKNLPHPIALVKTDADGKFKMPLPSSVDEIIIVASATRQVLDRQESYFWAIKVKPPASVTLSNDNLTEAASSESVLQTLALTHRPNPEDTADVLKADFKKLYPDVEKLLHDFRVNTGNAR